MHSIAPIPSGTDSAANPVNPGHGRALARHITLLGAICVALAACAVVRLLQLEGFSVFAVVCGALGVAAAVLLRALHVRVGARRRGCMRASWP